MNVLGILLLCCLVGRFMGLEKVELLLLVFIFLVGWMIGNFLFVVG